MREEEKDLVTRNYNLIYGFMRDKNVYRILDEDKLGDLIGALEERLCRSAMSYNPSMGCGFAHYAYRSFEFEYADYWRKQRVRERVEIDPESYSGPDRAEDGLGYWDNLRDPRHDVEQTVIARLLLDDFYRSISETERSILFLLKNGYRQKDIAEILEVSQSTVHRTKKKLTRFLQGE